MISSGGSGGERMYTPPINENFELFSYEKQKP